VVRGIELNVDLGELVGEPEQLYALATVANIACGGHAGDEASMRRALALAKRETTRVAAHPSYPDREGFGRRPRFAGEEETARAVEEQCASLATLAARDGIAIEILKLHGALYHDASTDISLARATLDAAMRALPALSVVVGPRGGALEAVATERRLRFDAEAFGDRRYVGVDKLAPRTDPDALLTDEASCVEQSLRLARSGLYATVCLHGDTPSADRLVGAVRVALEREGLLRRARGSAA
jgi:UPF0271 protein